MPRVIEDFLPLLPDYVFAGSDGTFQPLKAVARLEAEKVSRLVVWLTRGFQSSLAAFADEIRKTLGCHVRLGRTISLPYAERLTTSSVLYKIAASISRRCLPFTA
jgi:hypothetical protein